ncbi:MAG: ABC transporter permease [Planctomycetota bacterium]
MSDTQGTIRSAQPDAITGIEAMRGHGVRPAKGFWAEAWLQVIKRPAAVAGLSWVAIVAFLAVFAPLIASGQPLLMWELDDAGNRTSMSSPLLLSLSSADWLLIIFTLLGLAVVAAPSKIKRSTRLWWGIGAGVQATVMLVTSKAIDAAAAARDASTWLRELRLGVNNSLTDTLGIEFVWLLAVVVCGVVSLAWLLIPTTRGLTGRAIISGFTGIVTCLVIGLSLNNAPPTFEYAERERNGEIEAIFTVVPWSPSERLGDRNTRNLAPGTTSGQALARSVTVAAPVTGPIGEQGLTDVRTALQNLPLPEEALAHLVATFDASAVSSPATTKNEVGTFVEDELQRIGRTYMVGTDSLGQDVLSQLLHASRLSVSIGLVSSGIAVVIGVTLGALMGYFGGKVDLVLFRVVEIFMAIPVLFLLIVAAGVLPRNTYVMMAILGCFTWHPAARFTRAEFYRLRNQDFVQSARAVGLPLHSILFKHMLPNGVTPVLVDASFRIALAILFETIISYLGLGPEDQPSWGRLLADATGETGEFLWWLAIFPGFAIFLTVLAYNLIGEALRDAIDPKLKKARV